MVRIGIGSCKIFMQKLVLAKTADKTDNLIYSEYDSWTVRVGCFYTLVDICLSSMPANCISISR